MTAEADEIPVSPTEPERWTLRDIFVSVDGLRAGWALLLFLALREALLYGVGPIAKSFAPDLFDDQGSMLPRALIAYEAAGLFCVAVPTWIMARIEGRAGSAYGLSGEHTLRNFLAGIVWGVAMLSLLIFSLRACGLLVFDARLLSGGSAFRYGAIWLAGFLLVGLLEEYLFRGYMQYTVARIVSGICKWVGLPRPDATGFWAAAVVLCFRFGFIHHANSGESPIGLLAAGLIGMVFCLSLWRTGSLWWAIGFHTAWDWAQSFLYGVADSGSVVQGRLFATHPVGGLLLSGGPTGPEGSVLVLPAIALAAGVILLTLPRTLFVYPPASTREASLHLDLRKP